MNKELFLTELQAYICVLEDCEQQDILAEYAQHIDLKISGGLSEEEAIRDFGPLDKLAAEILEAYHVDPAHVKKPSLPSLPDPRPALRRVGAAAADFLRRAGKAVKRFSLRLRQRALNLFHAIPHRAQVKKAPKEPSNMEQKSYLHTFGGAAKRCAYWCGRALRALLRLIWNLAVLAVCAPFVCLGVMALLCTGTLIVLLVQGYPLAGITLCCFGGLLCCASLVVLSSSLLQRKGRNNAPSLPAVSVSAEARELEVSHE